MKFRFQQPDFAIWRFIQSKLKFLIAFLFISVVIEVVYYVVSNSLVTLPIVNTSALATNQSTPQRISLDSPKHVTDLNKDFNFSVASDTGRKASIGYSVESAELTNEIVFQGQKATTVQGRTFLIITLKLTNSESETIDINTKDYIRLTLLGNDQDMFAPDIYNDPVPVQAKSTKYAKVGFTIDEGQNDMKLWVGEIDGSKTPVNIHFDN